MSDPTDQTTTTTTTTSSAAAPTDTTTTTNDLTMNDLESKNDNDSIPSTSMLFPDVTPNNTHPDPLPSDLFLATLAASKIPISSSIASVKVQDNRKTEQEGSCPISVSYVDGNLLSQYILFMMSTKLSIDNSALGSLNGYTEIT
ncbi:hypothetical protein PPL_03983 [Heterostelium album PN500]|uniref:Uncharacterized protein n=1 Tax=Heterostelium pallidum (strain ATCC 26659 / Pp 5 / PN500) TaxID=670386 RepID=D3B5P5_HETP5|nr:hypothetical protein PPL_03983 [Heterostelium album PN500]EFA83193.1 hypothetical protein PPL_03983 [Heterostelium album PN500]|eukprot:XP_020435310.1 hypothetical protein PPL_03983 [Heterostelium album PN500]